MQSTIIYRRVTGDDATLFERVADEVFDEAVDPTRLAAYLAAPGHVMVIALAGDTIVGQAAAVLHFHPDKVSEIYIDEVGVSPAWQRQGIARRMVEELFAIGRERGCEEAWVGTELDNQPARRLYRTSGGREGTFVMYEYEL